MNIHKLVRPFLQNFEPYACARDEFSGKAEIWLDANENPFETDINRYPDPYHKHLKKLISELKHIHSDNIFLGNGSDEIIDLIIRVFCEPKQDSILILPPSYGMYSVTAKTNDVGVEEVLLFQDFQLDIQKILSYSGKTNILFICSPNNPSGNAMRRVDIIEILQQFDGIVVVDEAYADFSEEKSLLYEIEQYNNLVVLQTFSKAWGMAGARLGMCFTNNDIIQLLNKIKLPYNVNTLSAQRVAQSIQYHHNTFETNKLLILKEREQLYHKLSELKCVVKIHPSDANFLLVQFNKPNEYYKALMQAGIIVRNRSNQPLCEGCLRITIGTPEENSKLITMLTILQTEL
jgi:histidinol-phosphate aminotransferase